MNSSTHLRPMTIGDILDYSFRVYRRYFTVIFLFSLLLTGMFNLVSMGVMEQATPFSLFSNSFEQLVDLISGDFFNAEPAYDVDIFDPGMLVQMMLSGLLMLVLFGVQMVMIEPFVLGGIIGITQRYMEDREVDILVPFKASWSRFGRLIATALCLILYWILVLIAMVLVFTLLIMPFMMLSPMMSSAGIVFSIILGILFLFLLLFIIAVVVSFASLTYPVVMMEPRFHFDALTRSFQLIRRQFWKSIGVVVLIYLLTSIVSSSLNVGFSALITFAGGPWILHSILQSVVTALVNPVIHISLTLFYFDTRIRTEGLDIEYLENVPEGSLP